MRRLLCLCVCILSAGCTEDEGSDSEVITDAGTESAVITYEDAGPFGPNVLADSTGTLTAGTRYSMQAVVPGGLRLKVRLSGAGSWYMQLGSQANVVFDTFTRNAAGLNEQTFTFLRAGEGVTDITFASAGPYTLEYFETSNDVTRQRTLTVQ